MHQSEWLSERGGNFLNLLQKERVPRKGGSLRKGGGFQPWRKLLPHFFSLSAIAFEVDSRKILNYVINCLNKNLVTHLGVTFKLCQLVEY